MSARSWITAVLLGVLGAGAALAFPPKTITLERSWQDQVSGWRKLLVLTGDELYQLNLTVKIPQQAPLRHGEVERFRVHVQDLGEGTGGGGRVRLALLQIRPLRAYHRYRTITRHVHLTGPWVNHREHLSHTGRRQVGAPPTVEAPAVDRTTVDQPVVLSFEDPGFAANNGAATRYLFSFHRRQVFGGEYLVARGEFDHQDAGRQTVTIEPGGEFTQDAEEWFRTGNYYLVRVRMKREGTDWYSAEYGAAFQGIFEWESTEVVPVDGVEQRLRFRRVHGLP